ncbi:hypothetical protein ACFQ3J_00320 [Paenibacillus provencensis]|uniref:Uncharacterized protein n=1 Tax=Paenibacillus provencensis TaxID=441151 RepID=A0ABW3PKQ1_9BACL|nr:hypothetical protein [Paenibacillus sp. MER 78]MCM3130962.1 hypothetical protein [Paenibacillus sp. MER 78]
MAKLVIIFSAGTQLEFGLTEDQANKYAQLLKKPPQQWVIVWGDYATEINTHAVDSVLVVK